MKFNAGITIVRAWTSLKLVNNIKWTIRILQLSFCFDKINVNHDRLLTLIYRDVNINNVRFDLEKIFLISRKMSVNCTEHIPFLILIIMIQVFYSSVFTII